jgi:tRNA-2-methylthio-N6-dimethylallyladenosine synthase
MKKVYIKTYGCQMNKRDSEAVAAMLHARGYGIAHSELDADVVLLNTCSVRDLAEQKAIGKMSALARLKLRKPELILGYLGCMAQSRGGLLVEKQPAVDLVVGTQKFHRVVDYLDQMFARRRGGAIVDVAENRGASLPSRTTCSAPTATGK